jgi:hypothetical protein
MGDGTIIEQQTMDLQVAGERMAGERTEIAGAPVGRGAAHGF